MTPLFAWLQGAAPQTDALTRLLHQQQLTPWMIAAASASRSFWAPRMH
jgi:hypothetical protein